MGSVHNRLLFVMSLQPTNLHKIFQPRHIPATFRTKNPAGSSLRRKKARRNADYGYFSLLLRQKPKLYGCKDGRGLERTPGPRIRETL
ncbi:hypothetical protein, partial [uncultured Alistipes sp.]|uniref:hypothetical protein n=1 Tax=uncultured Alistipes sp. TaxID=538949 RepID=UPI0026EBB31B